MTEHDTTALTEEERVQFMALVSGDAELALVRATFRGSDVAVVTAVSEGEDGSFFLVPVAILMTDDLFDEVLLEDAEVVNR